jgi:hypothetical protein
MVEKQDQNEINFNIILCKLVYSFEMDCPYCKDKKSQDPILAGENIGIILKRQVYKKDNPNYGRIYYICSNNKHGFIEFQDGQPSKKPYHPFIINADTDNNDNNDNNDDSNIDDDFDNDNSIIGIFLGKKEFSYF